MWKQFFVQQRCSKGKWINFREGHENDFDLVYINYYKADNACLRINSIRRFDFSCWYIVDKTYNTL